MGTELRNLTHSQQIQETTPQEPPRQAPRMTARQALRARRRRPSVRKKKGPKENMTLAEQQLEDNKFDFCNASEASFGDPEDGSESDTMPVSPQRNTANQTQNRRPAQNPFLDYDEHEKRKQLERKWLQEDSVYMGGRKEEMRHNMVHRRLDSATVPSDRMFENVQFFNETAVKAKIKSALKEETRRCREETGILKDLAPARIHRLKAARHKHIDP